MSIRMRTLAVATGWLAAGVLAVGITGIAMAGGGSDSPQAPSMSPAAAGLPADGDGGASAASGPAASEREDRDRVRPRARPWLWRHLEHGEFVVRRQEGHQDFLVQRGAVTSVSGQSVTVRSPDGFTVMWELAEDARVRSEGDAARAADIKNGARVLVVGPGEGRSGQARLVRIRES